METLSYKIESFEGPMDLLLHLISKHKVRIEDVPIMDLINQYLDYMKKLKEENLEVASEFLEMAARLYRFFPSTRRRTGLQKNFAVN